MSRTPEASPKCDRSAPAMCTDSTGIYRGDDNIISLLFIVFSSRCRASAPDDEEFHENCLRDTQRLNLHQRHQVVVHTIHNTFDTTRHCSFLLSHRSNHGVLFHSSPPENHYKTLNADISRIVEYQACLRTLSVHTAPPSLSTMLESLSWKSTAMIRLWKSSATL